MKAQIFEIKRFAVHDGDGIRTTVFFKGCPLRCVWCHNPEGIAAKPQLAYYAHKCISCGECTAICPKMSQKMQNGIHFFEREHCVACGKCAEVCLGDALHLYGREVTVEALLPQLLEDKDFFESSGGGVTLSGGECLLQADFCAELLKRLRENGIHTAVDTCGFVSRENLEKVIPFTDIFLYDVKAINENTHKVCTGVSNQLILNNLHYLNDRGCHIEVRVPFVPGWNDGEMAGIAALLRDLKNVTRVRVLPYHSLAGSKYAALGLGNKLPQRLPTDEEIKAAAAIFGEKRY